jgi:hypothetical protein
VADDRIIHLESGVSAFNGKPFLRVSWGKEVGQVSPQEARTMASDWFDAAAAAEHDALLMAELQETVGLDFQTAGQVLLSLRARRERNGG